MSAKPDAVILCGGAPAPRHALSTKIVRLDLGGDSPNVDLQILDIARRLSTNVPDILVDLVEIASYVYCADQAVTRGGEGVTNFGAHWRRNFVFHIPVREPSRWSPDIVDVLRKTLNVLSEDTYEFQFFKRTDATPLQQYLTFEGSGGVGQELDEVLLFSGGVDSLGGCIQEALLEKRRIALVSHRSNPKIYSRQKHLVKEIRSMCAPNAPLHVPIWVHQRETQGREYTQRTRSFLYASLAFAVANAFGLNRIRFYENGVVSLNLPISEQVVGSRATRTTHPQVLNCFANLFSLLVGDHFSVENPFLWYTKTQVVDLIGEAGCASLIGHSVSCMHTRELTKAHSHCGRCSQCVSRRFATLASKFASSDPHNNYKIDLLTGERAEGVERTLVESFIRTAIELKTMSEIEMISRYGEIGRILQHLQPLSADQVAERVLELYKAHSREVASVLDYAISRYATEILEGQLPSSCAIVLALPDKYKSSEAVSQNRALRQLTKTVKADRAETRGRKAHAETNQRIAKIINPFGNDWKEHLDKICEALDGNEVPLPHSKKWKSKGCADWEDVRAEDKEGLVKALEHRRSWAETHPASAPSPQRSAAN